MGASNLFKDNDKLAFAETLKEHYEKDKNVYGIHSIKGADMFLEPPIDVIVILKEKADAQHFRNKTEYPPGVKKIYALGPKPLNDAKEDFLQEDLFLQTEYKKSLKTDYVCCTSDPIRNNCGCFNPTQYYAREKTNFVMTQSNTVYERQEEERLQFHDSCHIPPFKIKHEPVPDCGECDKVLQQNLVTFTRFKPSDNKKPKCYDNDYHTEKCPSE